MHEQIYIDISSNSSY